MAANINFGYYFKYYGSDIKDYHKNGVFDPQNVYVDGSRVCITIILVFTYFSKMLAAILDFFKFGLNGPLVQLSMYGQIYHVIYTRYTPI